MSASTLQTQVFRRAFGPLVLLALWEIASRTGILPERILAAPSQIFTTLGELTANGEIGSNVLVSLQRVLTGMAVSLPLGTALALLSGLSRQGEVAVDSSMQMARTVPFGPWLDGARISVLLCVSSAGRPAYGATSRISTVPDRCVMGCSVKCPFDSVTFVATVLPSSSTVAPTAGRVSPRPGVE